MIDNESSQSLLFIQLYFSKFLIKHIAKKSRLFSLKKNLWKFSENDF